MFHISLRKIHSQWTGNSRELDAVGALMDHASSLPTTHKTIAILS
jgi:hypothetical protein